MALEAMSCCGAMTRTYTDAGDRKHNPGCPQGEGYDSISKTVFTLTVLHRTEKPLTDISEALLNVVMGHAVGMTTFSTQTLGHYNVEGELRALGNDGTFFQEEAHD